LPGTSDKDAYDGLLKDYLRVCNKVLHENRNRFPYSQIWHAGEEALCGKSIRFAVYDDEPKAQCEVTLAENRIKSGDDGKDRDPPTKRLSVQYLEDVVADPQKYIENPALIDWDWLKPKTPNGA